MASYTTHGVQETPRNLKHNTHNYPAGYKPSNIDIAPNRTHLNYVLHPTDRGLDPSDSTLSLEYLHERMKEVYRMDRKDVNATAEWCITAPKELAPEQYEEFFQSTYEFLNSLYGEKNVIQCITHFDEGVKNAAGELIAGQPHMHYVFISTSKVDCRAAYEKKAAQIEAKYKRELQGPVTKKQKENYEKRYSNNHEGYIKEVERNHQKALARLEASPKYQFDEKLDFQKIDRNYLAHFHENYQRWIDEHGPACNVHSGITGGANRSVEVLKQETRQIELQKSLEKVAKLETELSAANEKIEALSQQLKEKELELENVKSTSIEQEHSSGWGHSSSGWSTQTFTHEEEVKW